MDSASEIIRRQCEPLFGNIGCVLDYVSDDLLSRPLCRWPLWRQFYHLLHSLDQWFTNPFRFKEPRPDGRTILALDTPIEMEPMTATELRSYYAQIESKIHSYLAGLAQFES